jgi:hypothetical protein
MGSFLRSRHMDSKQVNLVNAATASPSIRAVSALAKVSCLIPEVHAILTQASYNNNLCHCFLALLLPFSPPNPTLNY